VDFENNIPDWHSTVATPEGKIYVIGGADFKVHNHSSRRTYIYRNQNNSLVRLNDMNIAREAFSCVIINGLIYAVGGISAGEGTLTECEVYDPVADEWNLLPGRLNRKCCQAAICNFKNKYIYKFGGIETKTSDGAKPCELIEKYSIQEGVWVVLKPKIKEFILSAAFQINNNQIFVFGGVLTTYEKINDSFILNIDKEPTETLERIVGINQHPLPLREGFWNNQVIPLEGNLYALQNMKLGDVYYGSAVGHRKILKFSEKGWNVLN